MTGATLWMRHGTCADGHQRPGAHARPASPLTLLGAYQASRTGLSNTTVDNLRRAHAVHPVSALQFEYSIFARDSEPFFPVLEELGIGLVAYSPLARGFLSGAVMPRDTYGPGDFRQRIGWWVPENYDANVQIVNELTERAKSKGATLSQLALAWLLARKDYIVPIPGSRNPERVAQNIAAADLVLTANEMAHIEQIAPHGGIGSRQ